MRIDPNSVTTLALAGAPTPRLPRARRIRQTLLDGLYTVDLDKLAEKLSR